MLDEGKEVPEPYRSGTARSWRGLRLLAAAKRTGGAAAVGALYAAIGARVHGAARAPGHGQRPSWLDTPPPVR